MTTSSPKPNLRSPLSVPLDTLRPTQHPTTATPAQKNPSQTVSYRTGTPLSFTVSVKGNDRREFIRNMNAKIRGTATGLAQTGRTESK